MWQQGLWLAMCRETLMAEWGWCSRDWRALCMWRTVSRKVVLVVPGRSASGRTPPIETDWCGGGWRSIGGCQLWWVSKSGTPIKAGRGWPHPTVLRFNCLSRRSRCTCYSGWLRLANDLSVDGLKGVCVCRKGRKSVRTQRGSLNLSPAVTSNLDLSYLFTHLTPYYWAAIETHESSSAGLKSLVPPSSRSYRLNIQTDTLLHLLDRLVAKSKRGTHTV